MSKSILFISDLHLDPSRPEVIEAFCRFLDEQAPKAESLYILGDFLEYWIGDDQPKIGLESAIAGLKRLSDSGVPIFFICGNRDFLVGDEFAEACGMRRLADEVVVELFGEPTLIMHGDTLCTDDVDYQKLRALLRSEEWQSGFLAASIEERIQQAQALRDQSKKETQSKSEYITDVNQQAVENALAKHRVTLMIHGHTHRPAIHEFEMGGKTAKRVVLGDWYDQGSVLEVSEDGLDLQVLSLDADGGC